MEKLVLLIDDGNPQNKKIAEYISKLGAMPIILNTEELFFPSHSVSFNYNGSHQSGFIKLKNHSTIDLDKVFSIYLRGNSFEVNSPTVSNLDAKRWVERETKSNLISIIEFQKKRIINNPFKSIVAGDKIVQMRLANQVGFTTPKTLVTNDYDELLAFRKTCNDNIIFKSTCPPLINTSEDYTQQTIYTNILTDSDCKLKAEISNNLALYQEYIEKQFELRVIVVGTNVFACEIHSQNNIDTKIDWRRYNLDETPHKIHTLPGAINNKLINILKHYNLLYGAFDLIVTPSNEYIFLELNPDGIYDWIEVITGMNISESIAKELLIQ